MDENLQSTVSEAKELGLMQKITGIFLEPGKTFTAMANFPVKAVDWWLPVLLTIMATILMTFVYTNNTDIKRQMNEDNMIKIEERFNEMVEKGQMTQEMADEQLDKIAERMENQGNGGLLMQAISVTISLFIFFFILATVFFILARFILGDKGGYQEALVAFGSSYYVVVLNLLLVTLVSFLTGRYLTSLSVSSLLDYDVQTWSGFILSKVDLFTIWFYGVVSIALAKMFKSENVIKYFVSVYGLWIGFSVLMFAASRAVPFLKFFIR